jgi:DNA replicative helicase MCM subunit Mcm2 (Cdc46/Mcm family)
MLLCLQHKASYLTVQCKECRATQVVPCKPGLGGALLPRRCETVDPVTNTACPPNSWVVLGERSRYVDQQTLKLQVSLLLALLCCYMPCRTDGVAVPQHTLTSRH